MIRKSGNLEALDYEIACAESRGAENNTRLISPLLFDFLVDVEKAAEKALADNKELLSLFFSVYAPKKLDQVIDKDEAARRWPLSLAKIKMQVSRMFIQKNIHPINRYFKAKDLR